MVTKDRRAVWGPVYVLAVGALLYALSLSRTYVGFYYDDADYILTAMALIRGHFTSLRLPGQFVLHSHWPGFSVLLAPFIPIVQPHWALLKAIPFLCVLLCGLLAARWWRSRFPANIALGLLILFVWNPSTVERAGAVMTEPLFLLLILAAIFLLNIPSAKISHRWRLGFIMAAAAFVRPEGFLLTASIGLALYLWGEEREARVTCVPTAALCAIYFLLHTIGWLPFPGYLSDWLRNAPAFDAVAWIHQAGVQCLTLFAGMIFNLPVPHERILWIAGMIVTLLAMGMCVVGVRVLWRDEARRVQTAAIVFFTFSYFIFHVFWPVVDRRFLWPLLPIVLYLGISALGPVEAGGKVRMHALGAILAALLLSYSWSALDMWEPRNDVPLPRTTLEWVQTHLTEKDRILTNNPSMVYLYTGRPAIGLQNGTLHDAATFFYSCIVSHITTLVYFPPPPAFANLPATDTLLGQWEQSRGWADTRLYAYEKVFDAPQEGVSIYRVKPNAAYPQAFGLYISAMMDFSRNNAVWGKAKLTVALREDPEFPEAHTAYALCLLQTGAPVTEVELALKNSLRLDPTYPPTLAALMRIDQSRAAKK